MNWEYRVYDDTWYFVKNTVGESVWYSVYDRVSDSFRNSIWNSIRNSTEDISDSKLGEYVF